MSVLYRLPRAWVGAAAILAALVGLAVFWSRPEHAMAIPTVPATHDLPRSPAACPAASASASAADAAAIDVGAPLLPSAAPTVAGDAADAGDVPAAGLDDNADAGQGAPPPAVVGGC